MNGGTIENAASDEALAVQGTTDTNGGKAYINRITYMVGDIFS
jgi:hypothetical protein